MMIWKTNRVKIMTYQMISNSKLKKGSKGQSPFQDRGLPAKKLFTPVNRYLAKDLTRYKTGSYENK